MTKLCLLAQFDKIRIPRHSLSKYEIKRVKNCEKIASRRYFITISSECSEEPRDINVYAMRMRPCEERGITKYRMEKHV